MLVIREASQGKPSHGGVRGGAFVGNKSFTLGVDADPKCGGTVVTGTRGLTATCHRCGLLSSREWWVRNVRPSDASRRQAARLARVTTHACDTCTMTSTANGRVGR